MKFWTAKFETRNFTFIAYGETKAEALAALDVGWRAHVSEYTSADPSYLRDCADGVGVMEHETGACYRDSEKVSTLG